MKKKKSTLTTEDKVIAGSAVGLTGLGLKRHYHQTSMSPKSWQGYCSDIRKS